MEWLTKREDVAEVESREVKFFDIKTHHDLSPLKERMLPGDEVWSFSSPVESWGVLAGRAGFALIRDGRPLAHMITIMN